MYTLCSPSLSLSLSPILLPHLFARVDHPSSTLNEWRMNHLRQRLVFCVRPDSLDQTPLEQWAHDIQNSGDHELDIQSCAAFLSVLGNIPLQFSSIYFRFHPFLCLYSSFFGIFAPRCAKIPQHFYLPCHQQLTGKREFKLCYPHPLIKYDAFFYIISVDLNGF